MAIKKPLGGERLGSGKNMEIELHNYYRSTHNLKTTRKTTMAPGVLYPIWTQIGLNGDVFDMNIESAIKTLPTQAPLFGSFKLQVDVFSIPIRLYQGILHNNPINLGMNMNKVIFPKLLIEAINEDGEDNFEWQQVINPTSLLKYLGMSGLGVLNQPLSQDRVNSIKRKINAIPMLGYYDIFKNYYSNKQEDTAYIITRGQVDLPKENDITQLQAIVNSNPIPYTKTNIGYETMPSWKSEQKLFTKWEVNPSETATITLNNSTLKEINPERVGVIINTATEPAGRNAIYLGTAAEIQKIAPEMLNWRDVQPSQFTFKNSSNGLIKLGFTGDITSYTYVQFVQLTKTEYTATLGLLGFPLENIDKMRNMLLSDNELGSEFIINKESILPYCVNAQGDETEVTGTAAPLNGLCVKTYQSDIFNNWVKNELVEGSNGIAAITAVSTQDGSFTIDALNLAQKVYNMLNRIAASDGTYEDWQEVVYTADVLKKAETPIYCGGMSSEVVFQEITSTSEAQGKPLGTLGGKGQQIDKKGGNIVIKVKEPSVLMAIASLTPRIDYSQGNKWYLTELDNMDDLHKPALDGIGYEDLIGERMAWWDTKLNNDGSIAKRSKVGKSVAWINYMTDVDEVFGEFVSGQGQSYMVLNRNYSETIGKESRTWEVADFTTYIDPAKFNYSFANANIDAQNFWGAFRFDIKARRVMSAKQIPNL